MLLAAMLGLLLRLLVRGEYVFYVKPSFLPALIAAAGTPDGIPTLQVERHTLTQPPSNPYAQ